MDYVTDTHALVWYFTEDARLSPKALEAFEETIQDGMVIVYEGLVHPRMCNLRHHLVTV